ncbi:hypothetical protein MRB53_030951 [Persea americana]|uniref:Uncharacterized protein n=1 Tax=Persea americana TaxID=3435 RepID=A0ACC2KMR8_PERAE|nr:hypothetical protein MRB53_030951 [Persea americana]
MSIGIQLDHNSNTEDRYTVKLHRHSILTTVTATSTVVDQWISDIYRIYRCHLHHLLVGLDIEWRPPNDSPVATLQLCVGHRCLIFQLIHADVIPESLVKFLGEPDFTFVGVGIEEDVKKLENHNQLYLSRTSDLRPLAAKELGVSELKQKSLVGLATVVLGIEVNKPKRIRIGPWDMKSLILDQVLYACIDAFLSFEIGRKLVNGNRRFSVKWVVLVFFVCLSLGSWLSDRNGGNGAQSLL